MLVVTKHIQNDESRSSSNYNKNRVSEKSFLLLTLEIWGQEAQF